MIQFARSVGKVIPHPVAAFNAYNASLFAIANNTNVTSVIDTVVVDEGGVAGALTSNSWNIPKQGWWVEFNTITLAGWSAGLNVYRITYVPHTDQDATLGGMGVQEAYQEGTIANSQASCAILRLPSGGASNTAAVRQDSGSAKNASAAGARVSGICLSKVNSFGSVSYRTSGQSYTATVEAASQNNVNAYDEVGFWSSGSNTRHTVPTNLAGWYMLSGSLGWATEATTHFVKRSSIRLNGSTRLATHNTDGFLAAKRTHCFALYYLADADYVELLGLSGSTVTTTATSGPYAHFNILRVSSDGYPGACVTRTTTQSISASTNSAISFNSVVRDNWEMSNIGGAPTRLTVPTNGKGWYMAVGNVWWTGSTGGQRRVSIVVNGSAQWESRYSHVASQAVVNDPAGGVGMVLKLVAGDYVELFCENTDTGAQTTQANQVFLSLVRVDM